MRTFSKFSVFFPWVVYPLSFWGRCNNQNCFEIRFFYLLSYLAWNATVSGPFSKDMLAFSKNMLLSSRQYFSLFLYDFQGKTVRSFSTKICSSLFLPSRIYTCSQIWKNLLQVENWNAAVTYLRQVFLMQHINRIEIITSKILTWNKIIFIYGIIWHSFI